MNQFTVVVQVKPDGTGLIERDGQLEKLSRPIVDDLRRLQRGERIDPIDKAHRRRLQRLEPIFGREHVDVQPPQGRRAPQAGQARGYALKRTVTLQITEQPGIPTALLKVIPLEAYEMDDLWALSGLQIDGMPKEPGVAICATVVNTGAVDVFVERYVLHLDGLALKAVDDARCYVHNGSKGARLRVSAGISDAKFVFRGVIRADALPRMVISAEGVILLASTSDTAEP